MVRRGAVHFVEELEGLWVWRSRKLEKSFVTHDSVGQLHDIN